MDSFNHKGHILPSEDIECLFMKLPSFTQIDEMARPWKVLLISRIKKYNLHYCIIKTEKCDGKKQYEQ